MSSIDPLPTQTDPRALVAEAERLGDRLAGVRERVGRVIFGQQEVVDQALITLLAGGHTLLVGVPGLAKTRLVETLGQVMGLEERRIQCTPDLMPADIIGSEVLEEGEGGRRAFRFIPGPVFSQLLMADEVNRASPRTQSALLQAMQERRVSIAGHYHPLPQPFHVLATQNPIEQEGTYPLPEAQLDRFLLQIDVGYPDLESERRMLIATTGVAEASAERAMTPEQLLEAQTLIRPRAGRRKRGRGDPGAGARRAAGAFGDRRGPPPRLLGAGSAREPGADAGVPGAGIARQPFRALDRRFAGACRAGAQAPHGAELRRARGRDHAGPGHREDDGTLR